MAPPATAAAATSDFGFTAKPEMKDKPARTAALILVHTAAGTDVDVSAQTITGLTAPPPKTPPTAPPPAKPYPPQPSTLGVGAEASTGGLNEATSRSIVL